jgi:hypothetical protein
VNEIIPSRQHNQPQQLVKQQYYGRVAYYLRHTYEDSSVMLAYIDWAKIINAEDTAPYGLKKFVSVGAPQFYDVSCICRVVGYFEIGRETFIVDKGDNLTIE